MPFVKADLSKEKIAFEELISEDPDARKAYEEFQVRIELQQKLIEAGET